MKKVVTGLFLFMVTTSIGILFFQKLEKPTDIYISPNGEYKVELWGDKAQAVLPFVTNIVSAKIFHRDKFQGSTEIHYADWFDTSFDKTYFC